MVVDQLELLITSEAKSALAQLDKIEAKLLTVKSALSSTNGAVKGSLTGGVGSAGVSSVIAGNNAIAKSTHSLTSHFAKLAVGFFALRRGIQFGMKSIKSSMDFSETVNLFQTAFRKIGVDAGKEFEYAFLDQAQAFNDKISSAFGLDPNMLMNYQARFAQMTNSMGLAGQTALNISSSFTALGADIASLFNIDIADAMLKLQSGLAGQIRPLRTLGVDISKTSLMQTAWNYGIKDSFEKMSAASKVQLRYLATMEQLRIAMGDMARTINSPANQLRILKNQWDLLSRSMGNMFLPILTQILPYINGLMIALRGVIQTLAEFFGWKMPDWTTTDIFTGTSSTADDATTSIDSATTAAKKYKATILGIDQLNLMASQSDSSAGAGADNGGGGYSVLDQAIAKETKAYMDELDKQISDMKTKSLEFAEKIEGKLKKIFVIAGLVGGAILAWKISTGFVTGMNAISTFLGMLGGGTAAAGAEVFGEVIAAAGGAGAAAGGISTFALTLGSLAIALAGIYGQYKALKPVVEEANRVTDNFFAKKWNDFKSKLGEMVLGFKPLTKEIDLFGNGISTTTKQKVQPFTRAMETLSTTIMKLNFTGKIIKDSDVKNVSQQIKKIVSTITTELDSDRNAALKNLEPLKDALGAEAYNRLVDDTNEYYDKQKTAISTGETTINNIMKTAREGNRTLTATELKEINRIRGEMEDAGIRHLSETEKEYTLIMDRLKTNSTRLSLEQASSIIKDSKNTRDTAITNAKAQYDGVVLEANRMLEAKIITKDQYNEMVSAAERTRDKSITAANTQFDTVQKKVKTSLGDTASFLDLKTGEMYTNWDRVWKNMKESVSNFFTFKIPDAFQKIQDWFSEFIGKTTTIEIKKTDGTITKTQVSTKKTGVGGGGGGSFATGGIAPRGQLFQARENGIPEIVGKFGSQTGIMNNEQIVNSVAQGVAAAVKSVIGGGMGGGDWNIQIVDMNGRVTGNTIISAASRMNTRHGKTIIPIGG